MTTPTWTTRTIEQKGIELPYDRKNYAWIEVPPGTTIRSMVFIPEETLYELAEQDVFDSQFGSPLLLGHDEGKALAQAGLAVQETKGGYHRTPALLEFLGIEDD